MVGAALLVLFSGWSACVHASAASLDDPVLATFDGGTITLQDTEIFARELPVAQRVPRIVNAGDWRHYMARELGKSIIFTTEALHLGRQLDPGYLRGREYYLQEYLDYAMLRDNLFNKINVSTEEQEKEYRSHPQDYQITPTVTLRYMRTKNADAATSAAQRIAAGEDFATVERQVSEVSPRYIGRVLGPFPSAKARSMIPPPQAVLDAALATPIGSTTGPLQVGPNYFLAKTEAKTTGGLASLSEMAEKVESRIRDREGERIAHELLLTLRKELGVEQDDALLARRADARPDDVIATVGATLVTRQEFEDLNGRVRGPALLLANQQQSRLSQFITPLILAEAARSRGYLDHEETQEAMYFYDLQHLSSWYTDKKAIEHVADPTERELRYRFASEYQKLKAENRSTTPTFEAYRQMIEDTMRLERRPRAEAALTEEELQKRHWQLVLKQPCTWITAFEALVHVAPKLPKDSRVLEITEATEHTGSGWKWSVLAGRNSKWRITYTTGGGAVSEIISEGPATMSDSSSEFTSCPAYLPYSTLWTFDTDALFRNAIEKGMGDFAAKYDFKLRLTSKVEFSYSQDVPTSPTDCLVIYTAVPLDENAKDGLVLKYSGISGDVTHRRIGEPEGPCPTCPAPDLPAAAVLQAAGAGAPPASRANETSASVPAAK